VDDEQGQGAAPGRLSPLHEHVDDGAQVAAQSQALTSIIWGMLRNYLPMKLRRCKGRQKNA
jgi:hypothetical protein